MWKRVFSKIEKSDTTKNAKTKLENDAKKRNVSKTLKNEIEKNQNLTSKTTGPDEKKVPKKLASVGLGCKGISKKVLFQFFFKKIV